MVGEAAKVKTKNTRQLRSEGEKPKVDRLMVAR